MKTLLSVLFMATTIGLFAQKREISVAEGNYNFSVGSKNAIILTIPNSDKKVVEGVLKKEIKSWGGKMKASSGEYTTFQSVDKKLFDGKTFDTYTKIFQDEKNVKIAVATDLGGAFLNSNQHQAQFDQFRERLYQFGVSAGQAMVASDVKTEEGILKDQQKELKSMDKQVSSYQKQINSYQKKIDENNKKIEDLKNQITIKKFNISQQEEKIRVTKGTKVK